MQWQYGLVVVILAMAMQLSHVAWSSRHRPNITRKDTGVEELAVPRPRSIAKQRLSPDSFSEVLPSSRLRQPAEVDTSKLRIMHWVVGPSSSNPFEFWMYRLKPGPQHKRLSIRSGLKQYANTVGRKQVRKRPQQLQTSTTQHTKKQKQDLRSPKVTPNSKRGVTGDKGQEITQVKPIVDGKRSTPKKDDSNQVKQKQDLRSPKSTPYSTREGTGDQGPRTIQVKPIGDGKQSNPNKEDCDQDTQRNVIKYIKSSQTPNRKHGMNSYDLHVGVHVNYRPIHKAHVKANVSYRSHFTSKGRRENREQGRSRVRRTPLHGRYVTQVTVPPRRQRKGISFLQANDLLDDVTILQTQVEKFLSENNVAAALDDGMQSRLLKELSLMGMQIPDKRRHKVLEDRLRVLSQRPIMEVLHDKAMAKTQLNFSMPLQTLSEIQDCHKSILRPTVVTCHDGVFKTIGEWFDAWVHFMFHRKFKVCSANLRTDTKLHKFAWEFLDGGFARDSVAGHSQQANYERNQNLVLPMQLLNLAIYDAVLTKGALEARFRGKRKHVDTIRQEVCQVVRNSNQNMNEMKIIGTYVQKHSQARADVIFLTDVRVSEVEGLWRRLSSDYEIVEPKDEDTSISKEFQGVKKCLILLSKARFRSFQQTWFRRLAKNATSVESEDSVPPLGAMVAAIAEDHDGRRFLIASYHGTSCSKCREIEQVTSLLHSVAQNEGMQIILGLGTAMAYASDREAGLDICNFFARIDKLGMISVFRELVNYTFPTEALGQTPAQPVDAAACGDFYKQAQKDNLLSHSATKLLARSSMSTNPEKAVRRKALDQCIASNEFCDNVDYNPKDHIVFDKSIKLLEVHRRNGESITKYANYQLMPNLEWPSHHALLEALLDVGQVDEKQKQVKAKMQAVVDKSKKELQAIVDEAKSAAAPATLSSVIIALLVKISMAFVWE
eukprot:gnl/MRDRNA2_/MRDRNA2_34632_c0_seq1.p1 gnl/MRDRNA2_/MRDRNA2_34632_c0~~gnl/MRDRNA2_/MRDRNA2_34632_c0_seq1.p1  ORF type:complete len:944 (+),score=154.94 gnl/MRDRNA2_/MRDRNA2_34632_c0_seq1:116-2947(+)